MSNFQRVNYSGKAAIASPAVLQAQAQAASKQASKRAMSPKSVAILNWVRLHPECTMHEVKAQFCPEAPSGKGSQVEVLRARLNYLSTTGHLVRGGYYAHSVYSIGPGFIKPSTLSAAQRAEMRRRSTAKAPRIPLHEVPSPPEQPPTPVARIAQADSYIAHLVASASYDRMHGPVYVPPVHHCVRAGAMDYQKHASRGQAC